MCSSMFGASARSCLGSSDDRERREHGSCPGGFLLENYYLPGDLETQIEAFAADYNHRRYQESLGNLTPADVYFGRGQTILLQREGSSERRSPYFACSTSYKPRNIINETSQSLS